MSAVPEVVLSGAPGRVGVLEGPEAVPEVVATGPEVVS
jgi:hypothetical protein